MDDTILLLQQCEAGCKSATNSMEQVQGKMPDGRLKTMIDEYNRRHIELGEECHGMLDAYGEEGKDPNPSAKMFSWVSTEMKMMMNDNDTREAAKIMADGCNMGITSVAKYLNQCSSASEESKKIANEIIDLEKKFLDDLLPYM